MQARGIKGKDRNCCCSLGIEVNVRSHALRGYRRGRKCDPGVSFRPGGAEQMTLK